MSARIVLLSLVALSAAWSAPAFAQPADDQKAWAEACKDSDEWDHPAPPFKVFGNTWFVGTCGIGSILVTGENGHILIDGGTEVGGPLIAANIERLGFDLRDIRFLLSSHEHYDHVGGLAYLQRATGAILMANSKAAPVLVSGITADDDPQAGMHPPFPKIEVGGDVEDGDTIDLGWLKITALATPGHTNGAMSWTWKSCEGDDCRTIVYADSLNPVSSDSYRFSDHPVYVAAFRKALAKVAALDCDVLLTPHPSASGMRDKLVAGDLTSGTNCRDYTGVLGARLDARLAKEAAAPSQ
jgi:metallo-beta-lactamase class B